MSVPNSFNGNRNGNGGRLDGYSLNGNGNGHDLMGDLAQQEKAATHRHLYPAAPADFIKYVAQTLRDHRKTYEVLRAEESKLNEASQLATVGLNRLQGLVRMKNEVPYEHLVDLHRDFTFKNRSIKYILDNCKIVLDDTTNNMQFVGETLNSQLADRHKKKAVQQELGLRLQDIDADFNRCKKAVDHQNKLYRQLSEGIQALMNKASVKLPPKVKQNFHREDEVNKIAVMHQKSLKRGHDAINQGRKFKPQDRDRAIEMSGFGDEQNPVVEIDSTSEGTPAPVVEKSIDFKKAVVALALGIAVGSLFLYRDRLY